MMPGKSGYQVCREIRRENERLPIIFLTAREEEIDKVLGLELGADDYIAKPFGVRELLARIGSVLRRSTRESRKDSSHPARPEQFAFGPGTVDTRTYRFTRSDGTTVDLIEREVDLLHTFAVHPDQVLSREVLLEKIWGVEYYGTTRTLDQHIAKLRRKVEPDKNRPRHIVTIHGTGYRYRKKE